MKSQNKPQPSEQHQYKIGQILVAKCDIQVEKALSGDIATIPKGTRVIIGADRLAHHSDGMIQPLSKNAKVDGYDTEGLAGWIASYMRATIPCFSEALEDYDVDDIEIVNAIESALSDIGF